MNETTMPNHVAIIMDGNRRWAKERNLPTLKGHLKGLENLKSLSRHIFEKGTKYLSVFAFSTENFKRSEEEVNYLMDLLVNELSKLIKEFNKENIKVIFSGRKTNLRDDVLETIVKCEKMTKDNDKAVLNICFNYGGRQEVVDATKNLIELVNAGVINIDDIDEYNFNKYFYYELPDVDLMIRTSGEYRVSNFMLYNLAYAEMYFTDTYFPAFDTACYDEAINDFLKRNRRFGGNNK